MSTNGKSTDQFVKGLLEVIHEKKQDKVLDEVSSKLNLKVKKISAKNTAIIWSAVPVKSKILERILNVVSRLTKKTPQIINKIDKNLIAGFRVEFDDWVLDASAKSELDCIKKVLA